jgi:hypothetical protein
MTIHRVAALLIVVAIAVSMPPAASPVVASASDTLQLADFELGLDPRWSPFGPLVSGLQYTGENPPTLRASGANDGGNQWTVTSNGTAAPTYSDYDLIFFGPQDWRYDAAGKYTTLYVSFALTSDTAGAGLKVFLQAGGTYYDLGLYGQAGGGPNTTTAAINLGVVPDAQLEQVTAIKFRVQEAWFQGDTIANRHEYVTIKDIKIGGNPYLKPPMTFWPLPALDSLPIPSSDKNQAYWWTYDWHEGGARTAVVPGYTCQGKTALSATYFNDGAFHDDLSNPANLLAISHFKDSGCMYWRAGFDQLLRWYAYGFVTANTPLFGKSGSGNAASRFLTFRGDSRWYHGPSNVTFGTTSGVNDTIITNSYVGGAYWNGFKYTSTGGDNHQFPNYTILPDRMVDADVVLAPDDALRLPRNPVNNQSIITDAATNCGFGNWNDQRNDVNCTFNSPPGKWALFIRPTTYIYQGKEVLYVGYSESGAAATDRGPCEEWWYAKDIGPIYISVYQWYEDNNVNAYHAPTLNQCKGLLAGTRTANYVDVNNPEAFFNSTAATRVGYLKLKNYCILNTCRVSHQ